MWRGLSRANSQFSTGYMPNPCPGSARDIELWVGFSSVPKALHQPTHKWPSRPRCAPLYARVPQRQAQIELYFTFARIGSLHVLPSTPTFMPTHIELPAVLPGALQATESQWKAPPTPAIQVELEASPARRFCRQGLVLRTWAPPAPLATSSGRPADMLRTTSRTHLPAHINQHHLRYAVDCAAGTCNDTQGRGLPTAQPGYLSACTLTLLPHRVYSHSACLATSGTTSWT